LITGCGGDTGPVDDFIQKLAQAQCQWEFRCCTDAEIMQKEMMKFSDEATCEKFAVLALQEALDLDKLGVKQGRLAVDKASADACVAEQNNKMCNMPGGTTPPPMACMVDPCTQVFVGSTPANEACIIGGECAKGSHCVGSGSGTEGVCQPFQKEGEICNTSSDCDPSVCNLYCAHQDFKCHVRSPLGGPCAYTPDPVTGMPMTPLLLECDATLGNIYCDPDSSTCMGLPGEGEPCLALTIPGVFAKCDTSQNLFCDTSKGAPGTCSALPTLGQQCNTTGQCQKPYFCNFSVSPAVCDQPAQLGQMCSFSKSCDTTLFCDMSAVPNTCKAKLAAGSMCTSSQMCLSSNCQFAGGVGTGTCTAGTTAVMCVGR
jgi:hypothetical protein